jgi:hypothetical protein
MPALSGPRQFCKSQLISTVLPPDTLEGGLVLLDIDEATGAVIPLHPLICSWVAHLATIAHLPVPKIIAAIRCHRVSYDSVVEQCGEELFVLRLPKYNARDSESA